MLVAEILLHRTRAENVVSVYRDFIKKVPDIRALSLRTESQIEEMTKSLGLRWRGKLMIKMAKAMVNQFDGQIPCDLEELRDVPRIGDYIASALLVFSCGRYLPLLDTNTVRITARYFGLNQSDGSRRMLKFHESVLFFVNPRDTISSYYALIDLGALVCKSINPECFVCPLREGCNHYEGQASLYGGI